MSAPYVTAYCGACRRFSTWAPARGARLACLDCEHRRRSESAGTWILAVAFALAAGIILFAAGWPL